MRCVCGRGVKLCLKFGLHTMHAGDRVRRGCARTWRGEDGQHAVAHERVDAQRIDACPLHDASERGQIDVRVHAGRAGSNDKSKRKALSSFTCPTPRCWRTAPVVGMAAQLRRTQRRGWV